uniref:SFRICE_017508 n=1 Tax=Spodoptera frugiperda TaxID=7108 RepID=A0A2H1W9D5_SPOFR
MTQMLRYLAHRYIATQRRGAAPRAARRPPAGRPPAARRTPPRAFAGYSTRPPLTRVPTGVSDVSKASLVVGRATRKRVGGSVVSSGRMRRARTGPSQPTRVPRRLRLPPHLLLHVGLVLSGLG